MTRQKGVEESIRAVRLARKMGANIELHLFGLPDKAIHLGCPRKRSRI